MPPSLIPDTRVDAPLYWCTWQAQGRVWMNGASANGTQKQTEDYWRARTHQHWMDGINSTHLFSNHSDAGTDGWAYLFPRVRRDLWLMLDNGWQNGSEAVSTVR